MKHKDKSYEKGERSKIYSDFVCEEELRFMVKGTGRFKNIEKKKISKIFPMIIYELETF